MSDAGLKVVQRESRAWLVSKAAPLWLDRGVDWARGGFYESLSLVDATSVAPFKRLRVLTRQIYVFCLASRLGVPGARDAVDHGLTFLLGQARNPDGGFSSRFDLEGRTIDGTRDLYDLAFVVFALGQAFRLKPDVALRDEALSLLCFIRERMTHPAGGFVESLPDSSPRRQNPHMHLLESALVWASLEPGGEFQTLAEELISLFATRLFQPGAGVLLEYFGREWQVAEDERVVEPGHHCEWVWLLERYGRLGGDVPAASGPLMAFVKAYGFDRSSGLLYGELSDTGKVLTAPVRVWPHTEWLKAEVASGTATGALEAWRRIEQFLQTPIAGLWTETWDPGSQTFSRDDAPASTFYHLAMAIETALDG